MSMSKKHFDELAEVIVEIKQTSEDFVTRQQLIESLEKQIKGFCKRQNRSFCPVKWDNKVNKLLTKPIH